MIYLKNLVSLKEIKNDVVFSLKDIELTPHAIIKGIENGSPIAATFKIKAFSLSGKCFEKRAAAKCDLSQILIGFLCEFNDEKDPIFKLSVEMEGQ